jgi:hypothetical protein
MIPTLRKMVFLAHLASSIGWLGAVGAFLALAVAGLVSGSAPMVRSAYLAMQVTAWFVILPLAAVAVVSGVVSSLTTRWGLFRYYWIVIKLLVALLASGVLLMHISPIDVLATTAGRTGTFGPDLDEARALMVFASAAAVVVLLALTALSVFKPRGMTAFGWRRRLSARLQ